MNGADSGAPSVQHQLRNTLAAVDMLLESALNEIDEGGDPAEPIERAREGVAEAIEIIAARLEGA